MLLQLPCRFTHAEHRRLVSEERYQNKGQKVVGIEELDENETLPSDPLPSSVIKEVSIADINAWQVANEPSSIWISLRMPLLCVIGIITLTALGFYWQNQAGMNILQGAVSHIDFEDLIGELNTPKKVTTGVYLSRLWDIDITKGEFSADFWVWYRWIGEPDEEINLEVINITQPTELFVKEFTTADDRYADGVHYRGFRYIGRFQSHFDLRQYPFDRQDIVIHLEDESYGIDELSFIIDKGSSWASDFTFGEWLLRGLSFRQTVQSYRTNFGSPVMLEAGETKDSYARLSLIASFERNVFPYLLKSLLPLFMIVFISSLSLHVHPSEIDVRSAICVTTLLSTVALHMSSSNSLPNVGYTTIMDSYFILSYLFISSIALVVIMTASIARFDESKALMLNRWCGWTIGLLVIIGLYLIHPMTVV